MIFSFVLKQRRELNMWTEITRPQYERSGLRYASDLTDYDRPSPAAPAGDQPTDAVGSLGFR